MGLRMKNCNIIHESHQEFTEKASDFYGDGRGGGGAGGGGGHEKPIYRGEFPVKGGEGLGQFADLGWGGGLAKEKVEITSKLFSH